MNVQQLLHTVREDFLDDMESPHRWGATSLLRWLNRAQIEACRRQRLLIDEDTPEMTEVTLAVGTPTYTLDPRTHIVDRVVYDQRTIPKATKAELDRKFPAWRTMEPGEPMFYLQNDLTIRPIPAPSQAQDGQILTIRVWRLPLNELVEDSDIPEIPEPYHEDLCFYVAARAFRQPDEDLKITGLGDKHMDDFDSAFGPPMSADVLAHKRREGGTSWIGPSHAYHGRRTNAYQGRNPFDYED